MSSRLYFINNVPNAVRDNLEGLVTVNNHLMIHQSSNIVARKDFNESILSKGKVALISGGGSGHEPSHAGFVGSGLLTASVSGNIFASPTVDEVLRTIRLVSRKDSAGGTLLIVPNYTGDRLHFGSAKERASLEGYNVDIFVFGDDCVFGSQTGRVGPRGLAGVFFVHKISGALAESGSDLASIMDMVKSSSERIGSISISLGPCNVPGVGPSFVMPPGQLEVGLGIHGERGSDRISYIPVHESVVLLVNHLVSEDAGPSKYFSLGQPKRIALLFNDNGGLTTMEMNIIIRETVSEFTSRGYIIERTYSGRYVTSFDMIGVCISMMVVNDEILRLLDAPCSSVIISQGTSLSRTLNPEDERIIYSNDFEDEKMTSDYDQIDRLTQYESEFIKCVSAACQCIDDNEKLLNTLDSDSGDSDCGSTLALGARKILSVIASNQLKASFLQLSHIIESCMGGTSGALFSIFFTAASGAVVERMTKNSDKRLNIQDWTEIIKKSCDKMMQYSYARPGDKTLVDPLAALVNFFETNSQSKRSSDVMLRNAVKEVNETAESTAQMVAKIGRASFTKSKKGIDPGAWAVHLIFKSIVEVLVGPVEERPSHTKC